jgi:hypothetical protein
MTWPKYDDYVKRLTKGEALPQDNGADDRFVISGPRNEINIDHCL